MLPDDCKKLLKRQKLKRDPEFFGDIELELLYMARHLRDALRLEGILTSAGIDYAVETGPYTSGFFIKRELTGAYFYVEEQVVGTARALLSANKYSPFNPD